MPSRPEEPEESAAEKIYATLRECREQADPKRQKGVKMQGYLLKKKEKIGKWKQLFFLLKQDGSDSHLYFYDHPKVRIENIGYFGQENVFYTCLMTLFYREPSLRD